MKLKSLIIMSTTALLSAAILPAAYAQDGGPRLNRGGPDGFEARPERGDGLHRPGPGRDRQGLPGGNPEILIDRLDVDGDGYVSVDEFVNSRLDRIDDEFDRRDTDGDGLLSEDEADRRRPERPDRPEIDREEVIACVRETIADWEGPPEVVDRFEAVDTDGDGYIDLVELSTALEERAHELFDRIDTDDDGLISLEEVMAFQDYQINLRRVIHACVDEQSDPFEETI